MWKEVYYVFLSFIREENTGEAYAEVDEPLVRVLRWKLTVFVKYMARKTSAVVSHYVVFRRVLEDCFVYVLKCDILTGNYLAGYIIATKIFVI